MFGLAKGVGVLTIGNESLLFLVFCREPVYFVAEGRVPVGRTLDMPPLEENRNDRECGQGKKDRTFCLRRDHGARALLAMSLGKHGQGGKSRGGGRVLQSGSQP